MTYKVIKQFADLQDDNYIYSPGDTFPREGVIVKKERYEELASSSNKIGKPLIVAELPQKLPFDPSDAEMPKEEPKAVKKGKKRK